MITLGTSVIYKLRENEVKLAQIGTGQFFSFFFFLKLLQQV